MSNLEIEAEKEAGRLLELKRKHKELDTVIQERYNNYAPNEELNRLKTMKLWYKDEIHRLTNKLKGYL